MKRFLKLGALSALLCSAPAIAVAQQNDPDDDGILNPSAEAPAFGAYIDYESDEYLISGWTKSDYASYPQITNLPTIYITSTETVDFVDKTETYYSANIVIVDKHGTMKQRNEATTFRGRGNATWRNGTDKKPWRLKFPEKTGFLKEWDMENSVEINNYADAKSWTMLSNPFDKSMIRNAVTNELGKIVGLPFCPAYKFVDLVLNGEYFGTYQISDHMEVAKKRVWVNGKTDWFLELCAYDYREDPDFTVNGYHVNVKNPDDDPTLVPVMQAYMTNVFAAVSSKSGLKDYIDLQSLADFIIGMDMTSNFDGIKGNGYCYKGTGETDKLKFGPLWDLDLGYGNVGGWASASEVDTKHFWQVQSGYFDGFYKNIYESPEFQMVFYPRWKAVYAKGLASLLNDKVDEIYNLVKTSAVLNYTKGGHGTQKWAIDWTYMGLAYSGNSVADSYKKSCDDIKAFITSHVAWLNDQYAADYRSITGLDPETAVEPEPEPENPGEEDPEEGPTDTPAEDIGLAKYPDAEWEGWGGHLYTYTGSARTIKEGTIIDITTTQSNTDLYYGTNRNTGKWKDGSSWAPITSFELTAEDAIQLANNGYKFLIVVWDGGECTNVTVTPPPSDEENKEPETPEPEPVHAQLTNLPTVYLTATVGDEWSTASLEVYDKDNKLTQGVEWTNAAVEVQYQGSGNKEKDSYRLKFADKTKLLSSGKYKQWVLLANDDDPSLMRNALAKKMGDVLGLPFTPGYQFVDLYLNEEYMGTYQVTDRIKVEANRALVTGGNKDADWHVRFNDEGEYLEDLPDYYIAGTENMPYIIPKNPDPKDDVTAWESTLQSEMSTYFSAIFAKTDGHYTTFADNVDQQQLVQWYIAQEILGVYKGFSSIEAYRSVTEKAADQKLHIGVLWDSEKSLGNAGEAPAMDMSDLETSDSYLGLMTHYAAFGMMKDLFTDLWSQPWFARAVNKLWKEKRETLLSDLKQLTSDLQTELAQSQAKNLEKWGESSLGEHDTYAATIVQINSYLETRFTYLSKKFASLDSQIQLDIETMCNIILGLSEIDLEPYDLNADGNVNVEDLVLLIKSTIE